MKVVSMKRQFLSYKIFYSSKQKALKIPTKALQVDLE